MRADGVAPRAGWSTSAYSSYSGLPAVPREPRRRRWPRWRPTAGPAPRWTSCGTTSTTPASSSRWSTPRGGVAAARRERASGTRRGGLHHALDPAGERPRRAAPDGDAYVAQHEAWPRSSRGRRRARRGQAVGPRLPVALRRAAAAVARAGHQRPPRRAREPGVPGAVIVPIGFVSDHMEVVWDLDTGRARPRRARSGCPARAPATAGTDPRFVGMVRELVLERVGTRGAAALSPAGAVVRRLPERLLPEPARGSALRSARAGMIEPRLDVRPRAAGRAARASRSRRRGRRRAGTRAASARDRRRGTKSSATDVVTEMDRAARRCSSTAPLAAPRRRDPRRGGGRPRRRTGVRWVLDPIDGTVNYLYGLPDVGGVASRRRSTACRGRRRRRARAGRDVGRRHAGRRRARRARRHRLRVNDPGSWPRRWSRPVSATPRAAYRAGARRRAGCCRACATSGAGGAQHRPLLARRGPASTPTTSAACAALGPRRRPARRARGGRGRLRSAPATTRRAPRPGRHPALFGRLADLLAEAGDPG